MNYERCKKCRQWEDPAKHMCPPEWRVYVWDQHDPKDPSDGVDGWGENAEEVAREAIEDWDRAEAVVEYSADRANAPAGYEAEVA